MRVNFQRFQGATIKLDIGTGQHNDILAGCATMNLKQFQNHQPTLNNARPSIKILSQNPILPLMTEYAG
jgi:hypothetical protein